MAYGIAITGFCARSDMFDPTLYASCEQYGIAEVLLSPAGKKAQQFVIFGWRCQFKAHKQGAAAVELL